MIPRATYRLQFHAGFTFTDAIAIVPYLRELGISHVYASPLVEAVAGSMHGYDAIDPTRVSSALGGEDGLRRLVAALQENAMGMILDIVPNHVAATPANPWWWDVLRHGQGSPFATYFDIDWHQHGGRILLPVLGDPLAEVIAQGQAEIVEQDGGHAVRLYGEQTYPLAPGSVREGDLAATLDAQHYRLTWWRLGHDELNWRRFFSISELAGLRIEDDAVFEAVHELPLRLYREQLIDGLRIDHVDGLADPAAYLVKLRARLDAVDRDRGGDTAGARAWLVVEKILGPGERLPREWPVDGTTGYGFMDEVSLLLHDADAEEALTQHWAALSGRSGAFEEEEVLARRQMVHWQFSAQLEACVDALATLAARAPATARYSRAAWARAVETVLMLFPVYRTYGTGTSASPSDAPVRAAITDRLDLEAPPGEAELARAILGWLAGEGPAAGEAADFVRRFQQLSAPIAAKAVEDTAFYRYGRLLSRTDVGFDAARFAVPVETFHRWQEERAQNWPRAMLTTATHDHKRGEDVRARLFALSTMPADWIAMSRDWLERMPGADEVAPDDLYMLLQAMLGAWPDALGSDDTAALAGYRTRLEDYALKAVREAKLRSSWVAPDETYERAVAASLAALLCSDGGRPLRAEIIALRDRLAPVDRVKSLAQTFLRNTCPGIPDLYQGAELADRSLVDPDNRRPVDFALRTRSLAGGTDEKQRLIHDLLQLRERYGETFAGPYRRVPVLGMGDHIIAFTRGGETDGLLMVTALGSHPEGHVPDFSRADDWLSVSLGGAVNRTVTDLIAAGANLLPGSLPCAVWAL